MTHSNEPIHQLTDTVNTLAAIMVKNENRYLSIEKSFRWVAVGFVCLTLVVFYLGFNMVSKVQAQAATASSNQTATDILVTRIKEDSDLLRQTVAYYKGVEPDKIKGTGLMEFMNLPLDLSYDPRTPNPTGLMSIGDALVLVHRLRRDSDSIRKTFGKSPNDGLINDQHAKRIAEALNKLSVVLAVMPGIAIDAHEINLKMGIAVRDIDATVGRMGRMMPPGWW